MVATGGGGDTASNGGDNNNNTNANNSGGGSGGASDPTDAPGEATLLVSEFPPPPFYYYRALDNYRSSSTATTTTTTTKSILKNTTTTTSTSDNVVNNKTSTATSTATIPKVSFLKPPDIPVDALNRGTRRAAAAAARARAEAERIRLLESGSITDIDKTDAILGGVTAGGNAVEEEGDVVAVFGEIVEDPLMVQPHDLCHDPKVVRDEVKRLNRQVVQGFVKLVQDLVHRPMENKKTRDELSHNIFLMLQECNKFREHQSREILIQLLEKQLHQRKQLISVLQDTIAKADMLLETTVTTTTTTETTETAETRTINENVGDNTDSNEDVIMSE